MFDQARRARPTPNFSGLECQNLSDTDHAELWDAANRLVNAGGLAVRLTGWLSQGVTSVSDRLEAAGHRVFGAAWDGIETKVRDTIESVLWKAHDVATIGVRSKHSRDPWSKFHRLSASASGAVSGFAGLPGLVLDIPVTTTLMLRSIAEIAREHGEDIASADGKRACLEVLAQNGLIQGGEEAEAGYWSARAGLSHLTITMLIRTAASRLGVTLSEKILAQAVPVAGAMAGAGLNWVFMGYYQEIARVHFTLRAVERRTGDPAGARACFDRLVAQARGLKKTAAGPVIDAVPAN